MKRAVLKLYRATEPAQMAAQMSPALRALDRPALVIWGEGDAYLPLKLAERQRDAFPRAEIVTIRGAGHWPFVDDPDAVREPLLSFLRTQITGPVV
jgi:pimeloyl-ACP methyl ester carboxylesterase